METTSEKGQALVELTIVLLALIAFAMLTVTQWQKFREQTAQNYFSVSKRK